MHKSLLSSFALILAITLISPSSANPNAAGGKGLPSANASGYWTEERRNSAIPREFEFEVGAKEGKLVPQAKRGGTSGGSTKSGTSYWSPSRQGELVARITGKVFFEMGTAKYVCSASLVQDGVSNLAVVLTAAHCVFDDATGNFASKWTFFPNYDKDSKTLRTEYVASILLAPKAFTDQSKFNTTAILNDFAFAVIVTDKFDGVTLPLVSSGTNFSNSRGDAFGYPASSPYNGAELVWSTGTVSTDINTGNQTWRLPSSLTGGASGGPWYNGFKDGNSVGTISSLNSYKYGNDKDSMYGPKFNGLTDNLLAQAVKGNCAASLETISCKTFLID